jgi:hypothetical protein
LRALAQSKQQCCVAGNDDDDDEGDDATAGGFCCDEEIDDEEIEFVVVVVVVFVAPSLSTSDARCRLVDDVSSAAAFDDGCCSMTLLNVTLLTPTISSIS